MDPRQVLRFCPRCGAAGLSSDNGHRFVCAACSFVFFLNNAAAVGVIIEDDDGRVLVARRGRDPGAGKLDWPGGFVDPGEGLEECLHRELREELAAQVESLRYLTSHENHYTYGGLTYRVADAFFVVQVADREALQAGDDVADFLWADPDELDAGDFAFASAAHALWVYRADVGCRDDSPG